jgi:hypothetical protein
MARVGLDAGATIDATLGDRDLAGENAVAMSTICPDGLIDSCCCGR